MAYRSVLTIFAICFVGSIIGSFVALVADRWPRGEDIVVAPLRCRPCGLAARLAGALLGYSALKRLCGVPIARCAGAGLAAMAMPLGTALAGSAVLWLAFRV